ncbi:MAG TPA: 4-(cytidine 5'-diphospho)-2-C-methyl-D-erythritol kinase [Dongiaceae bacterium]|nr:4-(cytidine 5'-diphospho)-2-C-methyl-D-erythritol kinase [Dongiaceae bacterium]
MPIADTGRLARAKINLYLHVVGKRADGYHLLDSLIVFAETGDVLRVGPADDLSLAIDGPFAEGLAGEADNLVLRAARALATEAGIDPRACIHLTKSLPIASGIGGGSADAAAALLELCRLWRLDIDTGRLQKIALALGADVPVCVDGRPAFIGGIGEEIVPAGHLPGAWLVLVNPKVPTPTPQVFKARRGDFSPAARWQTPPADLEALVAYLAGCCNDLTEPAISVAPTIADVLAAIAATDRCRLARLSGSGATCFGLYGDAAAAVAAQAEIVRQQPGWWAVAARIAG